MEYAKLLERSAGKFDYRESPLKTQMKVNELRKTINKDGRANIIKQEPYANKIATYLSKEELKRKTNEGASRYKMAVQDEYDNLILDKLKNRKDDEFMKTAKKQSEFMKLISDPSKIEYLNKVDPFGLFLLRQKQEKDKNDFIRENNELQKYKDLRQKQPEKALQMFQFSENPLIKLFGSHPEDEKLVQDVAQEVGDNNVARRIVAHSGIDAMADQAGLSEGETEELHKEADQVPITDPRLTVENLPLGPPATFAGKQLTRAPVVEQQSVSSLSGATGPEGPITLREAESMDANELKQFFRTNYNYNIKSTSKNEMIKELIEHNLVTKGVSVSSLPSFLPEDIIETEPEYEQREEEGKKKKRKSVVDISLMGLFRLAKKDLEKLEEDHQREVEELELQKQDLKADVEKKREEKRQELSKLEEKQQSRDKKVKEFMELFRNNPSNENQKIYEKAQKEYDENQKKIDELKHKVSDSPDSHYSILLDTIEKKHLERLQLLQQRHRDKVSKYGKGKGFKPLSSYPKHIIAGALNKNYLRYKHLIPNQNEYNREQAYHLTQNAIHG